MSVSKVIFYDYSFSVTQVVLSSASSVSKKRPKLQRTVRSYFSVKIVSTNL